MCCRYTGVTVLINSYTKINRTAAHLAIFNIVLLRYGAIDKNFDKLATIGALYIFGAKVVHVVKLPSG